MRTFLNVLRSEWLKMRKANIWLLVFVSPALAAVSGFLSPMVAGLPEWEWLFITAAAMHAFLFLPLLTGVFAAFVCRYEHAGGGWKQVLTLPVSRTQLYLAKFTIVIALLAVTQLLLLAVVLTIGTIKGFTSAVPWDVLLRSVLGGWVATLPLASLQMFVSVAWSSFAAPLAINVIFTIPNMLIVNSSDYGPYYPWAQPVLSMLPKGQADFGAFNVPLETLLFVILGSFLVFFASGLTYFRRKEI
ncbi:ABC transporter permease [Paenibacillus oleatilyticus]|uniref:ABC transporter permease n=1 Tax=Paenibacillus oleatilyticus TaxID=2594886 RepID=UPI001C1FBA21|nr:ABC transporter permease [Paenibacillus oleatilyticus]MBU7314150.1 ABC transporter permease [Paenibacillus oleatilyticus]